MDSDKKRIFATGVQCLLENQFTDAHSNFTIMKETLSENEQIPVLHNIALVNECMHRIDVAMDLYVSNIEKYPHHILSYLCLSNCFLYKDNISEAIKVLDKALDQGLDHPQIHILLSELYFLLGDRDAGLQSHIRGVKDLPGSYVQTQHHVQQYTDFGGTAPTFYSFIEDSYISSGKKPSIMYSDMSVESPVKILVLGTTLNSDAIDQLKGTHLFVVARDLLTANILPQVDATCLWCERFESEEEPHMLLDLAGQILKDNKVEALVIPSPLFSLESALEWVHRRSVSKDSLIIDPDRGHVCVGRSYWDKLNGSIIPPMMTRQRNSMDPFVVSDPLRVYCDTCI